MSLYYEDASVTVHHGDCLRPKDSIQKPHAEFGTFIEAGGRLRSTGSGANHAAGRWPANVILDESSAAALDAMSGASASRVGKPRGAESGDGWGMTATGAEYDDQGGASRFFYVAGKDEPCGSEGIITSGNLSATEAPDGTPTVAAPAAIGTSDSRFFYTAKASTDERITHNGTAHPTVKPLDLMRYLVRLVTPPGGIILEPFAGSGTTVEAAILEGFRCIAIEREADYLPLITQRIHRRRDPIAYLTEGGHDMGLFELDEPA